MFDIKTVFQKFIPSNQTKTERTVLETMTQLAMLPIDEVTPESFIDMIRAINRLNNDPSLSDKKHLDALLHIDEQSTYLHQKLCKNYILSSNQSKTDLANILAYWSELSKGYNLCIKRFQDTQKLKQKNQTKAVEPTPPSTELQLATNRAIRHHCNTLKWSALNHTEPAPNMWLNTYRLYLFAEKYKFHKKKMVIYPGRSQVSSEFLLIRTGMLFLAQTDNLSLFEIEGVDLLLGNLVDNVTLSTTPLLENFQYVFDLSQNKPPQLRLRADTNRNSRFWSGEQILNRLGDAVLRFDRGFSVNLVKTLPALNEEEWLALLDKLATRWTQDGGRSMRKTERSPTNKNVSVLIGFDAKAGHVVDNGRKEWTITDESEQGLGLLVYGKDNQLLKLHTLLAIQNDDKTESLAVVYRFQHMGDGGTRVGSQRISTQCVRIKMTDPATQQVDTGFYIPPQFNELNERMLVIKNHASVLDRLLSLDVNGKLVNIKIREIIRKYNTFSLVTFDPY
jgi:hypothetical protein